MHVSIHEKRNKICKEIFPAYIAIAEGCICLMLTNAEKWH